VLAPAAPPALWNPDAVGILSLFLTTVFGSILLLLNWKALGDERRVTVSWLWLLASIGSIVASLFIPFGTLIFLIIWYFGHQRKQTQYVTQRWGLGYPRRSLGLPVLLGLLFQLVLIGTVTLVQRGII
jgi:hypothetical protein